MEPLARIRSAAKDIAQLLRMATETQRDARRLLGTIYATHDIITQINDIGRGFQPLPDDERAELMGIALDVMNMYPEAKPTLLKVIKEYGAAYRNKKMAEGHRKRILKHLQSNAHPQGLKRIYDVLRAINSAKKNHVDVILESLDRHGIEKFHPVAKTYTRSDPAAKEVIVAALQRANTDEHLQRILYHANKLRDVHPEVKKRVARLAKDAKNFQEIDHLVMAAHHASGALRAGARESDVFEAFTSKELAIRRFGKPWKGWEHR